MSPVAIVAAERCTCADCIALDRALPLEGWQLRLPSSGGRPDAAPLTDPDAPAVPAADVSAPQGPPRRDMRSRPIAGDAS